MKRPPVYTIPADQPFARHLAAELLRRTESTPEKLADIRILLPTRRACRAVRDAFLRESSARALLLPQLQPIGDIDEEDLSLAFFGEEAAERLYALPPAMPARRRQIILARLLMARADYRQDAAHALNLAADLGRLLDRLHTEDLGIEALDGLAGQEFAAHWQITLNFLKILKENWPKILETEGLIDPARRRNELAYLLADLWRARPPQTPVIAAGTTGSIRSTAKLLEVIADLPRGEIILPGFDRDIDGDSWNELDDGHPQKTMKGLLDILKINDPRQVMPWPDSSTATPSSRTRLAREIMRPATTSAAWRLLDGRNMALAGLSVAEAETPQEEAFVIALALRHALETPEKTAALITPDRVLARRVAAICGRWDIEINDSSGIPLPQTGAGSFLTLTARVCATNLEPAILLALLRHSLCHAADPALTSILETSALRGPRPPSGFSGIRLRLGTQAPPALLSFVDRLENALRPLSAATERPGEPLEFSAWLESHIRTAEALAGGSDSLWSGDDGEAAALLLSDLREQTDSFTKLTLESYVDALESLMNGVTVRPSHGAHPRLSILGPMEARLIQADLVILGGFNEGTWPADPGHDPWMSRPMRAQIKLPPPERMIGLAAHDVTQALGAPEILITRARRVDGAPAVPSRWLQRLDAVLRAAGQNPETIRGGLARDVLVLARTLDRPVDIKPAARPAPCPPVAIRPRTLSVTEIQTLMANPYAIYARHVLKLRPLKDIDKKPDRRDRGNFLHDVLHQFILTYPHDLPADPATILADIGSARRAVLPDDEGFWNFWWPRFERISGWFAQHEKEWRARARPQATETKGRIEIAAPAGSFILHGRADRIDRLKDGTLAIIDYKTGGTFSPKNINNSRLPQLPLEGLIARQGGFANVPAAAPGYLGYWVMSGAHPPGDDSDRVEDGLDTVMTATQDGLLRLIAAYDDPEMPYLCLPDPGFLPDYEGDYDHLARVQEWATQGDDAEAA